MALQTNLYKDSPRRAPHWRWLRAVQIDAGGPRASQKLDGPDGCVWIRRASRMKRRWERAGNQPAATHALILRDSDMFWAHTLWAEEKNPTRWGIEARVLAGESDAEIAEKMGTTPEIVSAYVNVFFDVREKLHRLDYVLNVVLSDAVTRGLQERHYDLLWKLMGYRGGPHVLDAVLSRFINIAKPDSPDGVSGFFQEFAINSMKYKAALASLTVQVNTQTQLPLIDSFVKYVEIERNTENAEKAQSSIVTNIGAMLTGLPFKVGTKLDSEGAKMLPFDNNSAELRGDEMLIIAAGENLNNAADIQQLTFPGE